MLNEKSTIHPVAALVLAAGLSTRMGRPKMVLPWDDTTVIGKVVATLSSAGLARIVVVTGGAHAEVVQALQKTTVRTVFNPDYANGEMLRSLQIGLQSMDQAAGAALIVLGDQPQIEEQIVRDVVEVHVKEGAKLVVPSFQMRRGHPWLVERSLWPQMLALAPPQTLRDFMQANASVIRYLNVDSSSILQDLDTPEDYARQQGRSGQ